MVMKWQKAYIKDACQMESDLVTGKQKEGMKNGSEGERGWT